jgi:thermitase
VDYAHGLGALVCVAMMNANSTTPYYPANYTNPIAVGATNNLDWRAVPFCWGGGSSYGAHIELVAPGDWIYSTLWDNT